MVILASPNTCAHLLKLRLVVMTTLVHSTKPSKGRPSGMNAGHGAGQSAMLDLTPLRYALFLEPGIERIDIREARQPRPQSAARILHVLLDLSLLPPRGWVTELGLEHQRHERAAPRPLVCASRWRSAFQPRANVATRP